MEPKICIRHGTLKEEETKTYTRIKNGKVKIARECRICYRASACKTQKKYRKKAYEWRRKDKEKNPDKYRAYDKKTRVKHRVANRLREVLRAHGITKEEYDNMFEQQNGLCKICENPESRMSRCGTRTTNLSVDHCHLTNVVRGLLCFDCNTGLGKFKDSQKLLHKAALYLNETQKEKVA